MSKLLLIDDKMDNLITLSALLKNLMPDCVIITAQSGLEGIEKAGSELPDTILLDVRMPDMDGFETCRRLKSDEITRHIPVIMITAINTDPKSRIKGLEIGADAFLAKPVDSYELVSQVNVALRIKKAEDALREERDSLERVVEERTAALKEREEALYQANAILQAAMDQSTAGIAIADAPEGKLRYVNKAALLIRGEDGKTIVNGVGLDRYVDTWRIMDLDGRPLNTDEVPLARAIMFGETCSREFIIRRAEDDKRTVWANASPITDPAGNVTAGIVVFLDITERKRAEEELRRREAQYNAIVENSGDYIMRYDGNHRHIFGNRGAIEATGLSPEQYLGRTHREMGFPEHLCELWEKNIDEVFATGEVRRVEFDVELQDGWITLDLQLNPEFGPDGRVQSVIGISRDITDLKAAQREERLNKMRLEIIRQITDVPDVTEKDIYDIVLEKMVDLSESKIGFLGFITEGEQVMRIPVWSSSAMAQCAIHDKPITFSIDQTGLWGEPVRTRKPILVNDYAAGHPARKGYPKGLVPISRFMSVPVIDNGRVVAVAAVANKINPYHETDLHQLGLLMSNAWELIQRRRMKLEKEMLITQLRKAQKMESIGNLAGGIAHDFNNILASIIGFTELTLDEVEKGSLIEENLQEVFTAGIRARDLVKQILAFARKSEEELKPIQVDTIVREVLKFIRSSIPTSIEIIQNIQSSSLIMGNATQVHQVLMNLCANAAYAMEDEGGILELGLKDVMVDGSTHWKSLGLKPGNFIEIKVSDTGVGIPPEIIDSIFEPYFTTKNAGEGTGLGLAMVHGITGSHGGKIAAESKPGKGTTFRIYLPVTGKRQGHRPYQPEKLAAGTERILFVDDEASIAKMEAQALERLGYKVSIMTDSEKALDLFGTRPNDFDLVITDMTMPNMTGDKLAMGLMEIRPDIPVILCTGYSKKISEDIASEIGIRAFAYKPIVKSELAKTVRKVLDEAKGSGKG